MPVTVCSAPSNLDVLTYSIIQQYAAEAQFSAAYCFAPVPEDSAPESIQTLVLLVKSYAPGGRLIDRFYPASNAAYHAAKALTARISREWNIEAIQLSNLRMKPMCRRHPSFGTGMNTLNYLPGIGSRFCLELLGLSAEVMPGPCAAYDQANLPCAACRRCAQVCPGGAITTEGFQRDRCIRNYMMSGKPMPEHLREYIGAETGAKGVIGCDLCQRVCPANANSEKQWTAEDDFTLKELLTCDAQTLERFGALYGKNYVNRNRMIAQALLTAANMGDTAFLKEIETLTGHPSALVAEHARWAREKIEKKR